MAAHQIFNHRVGAALREFEIIVVRTFGIGMAIDEKARAVEVAAFQRRSQRVEG